MNGLRGPAADLIVGFVRQIGAIADEMTFCGGNAAQLLVTDPLAVRVRATDDLDVIVVATSRPAYERLRQRLAEKGMVVDSGKGAPICRFRTRDGMPVDVMPIDGTIVDLETAWFREAVDTALHVTLQATSGDEAKVSLVSAPAFLALKWSAYADRGRSDPMMSRDFEDILTSPAPQAASNSNSATARGKAARRRRARRTRKTRSHVSSGFRGIASTRPAKVRRASATRSRYARSS